MADFFQDGSVATLHRLGKSDLNRLERELDEFSTKTPIALVLPCHVHEIGSPALHGIIHDLQHVSYIHQIIIGIDGADAEAWKKAKQFFDSLPQKLVFLWNDGPRMQCLLEQLAARDLDPGPSGKGRNLWLCFGYVLADGQSRVVTVHDCDILTYSREMLARLCYPVAHPTLGFDFCKGYSARYSDKLYGRVMRLLFTPLVRSLRSILGSHPFLTFLDTFRYPLAGEMSLSVDIIRRAGVPSDWGFEVGILAEVFRVVSSKSICQADIAERYDHKHQDISAHDASKGLHKMAVDIVKCIFRTLAGHGVKLDSGAFDSLLIAYARMAEDTMEISAANAEINGLIYDLHEEELAVDTFARSIRSAAHEYLKNPVGEPIIPNWNLIETALPEFLPALQKAVLLDNAHGSDLPAQK